MIRKTRYAVAALIAAAFLTIAASCGGGGYENSEPQKSETSETDDGYGY